MKNYKLISWNAFVVLILVFCVSSFINITKEQTDVNTKVYESEIRLTQNFLKCGHIVDGEKYDRVSYSTNDELLRRFEGYKIASSDGKEIVLAKNIRGFCPSHYLALLKNNEITVTNLFDGKTVAVIKTVALSLSEHEKKLLTEGLTLNSEEALSSFIEDFTS